MKKAEQRRWVTSGRGAILRRVLRREQRAREWWTKQRQRQYSHPRENRKNGALRRRRQRQNPQTGKIRKDAARDVRELQNPRILKSGKIEELKGGG
jgi:hypothetical protein